MNHEINSKRVLVLFKLLCIENISWKDKIYERIAVYAMHKL